MRISRKIIKEHEGSTIAALLPLLNNSPFEFVTMTLMENFKNTFVHPHYTQCPGKKVCIVRKHLENLIKSPETNDHPLALFFMALTLETHTCDNLDTSKMKIKIYNKLLTQNDRDETITNSLKKGIQEEELKIAQRKPAPTQVPEASASEAKIPENPKHLESRSDEDKLVKALAQTGLAINVIQRPCLETIKIDLNQYESSYNEHDYADFEKYYLTLDKKSIENIIQNPLFFDAPFKEKAYSLLIPKWQLLLMKNDLHSFLKQIGAYEYAELAESNGIFLGTLLYKFKNICEHSHFLKCPRKNIPKDRCLVRDYLNELLTLVHSSEKKDYPHPFILLFIDYIVTNHECGKIDRSKTKRSIYKKLLKPPYSNHSDEFITNLLTELIEIESRKIETENSFPNEPKDIKATEASSSAHLPETPHAPLSSLLEQYELQYKEHHYRNFVTEYFNVVNLATIKTIFENTSLDRSLRERAYNLFIPKWQYLLLREDEVHTFLKKSGSYAVAESVKGNGFFLAELLCDFKNSCEHPHFAQCPDEKTCCIKKTVKKYIQSSHPVALVLMNYFLNLHVCKNLDTERSLMKLALYKKLITQEDDLNKDDPNGVVKGYLTEVIEIETECIKSRS